MDDLTFASLRAANVARIPLFKDKFGRTCHATADGSDWTPAQWLQAVVGELGEYANLRKKYERGDLSGAEFSDAAAKELADIVIYLDILAFQLDIDLGAVVRSKFNEVSQRINVDVWLGDQPDSELKDYYVLLGGGGFVMVKDGKFFVEQGGTATEWGKQWTKIKASSIEDARARGQKMFHTFTP